MNTTCWLNNYFEALCSPFLTIAPSLVTVPSFNLALLKKNSIITSTNTYYKTVLHFPSCDIVGVIFALMFDCTMIQLMPTQSMQWSGQYLLDNCVGNNNFNYTCTLTIPSLFSSQPRVCAIHSRVERLAFVGWVRMTYSLTPLTWSWTCKNHDAALCRGEIV